MCSFHWREKRINLTDLQSEFHLRKKLPQLVRGGRGWIQASQTAHFRFSTFHSQCTQTAEDVEEEQGIAGTAMYVGW